jgi:hypothetical protein
MDRALAVINQMERDGVIARYAIGGAIAATRYVEPIQTYDLDIFVMLPALASGLLSITPIYAYLTARGYQPQGESIMVEGWPVQFLPAYNPLTEEALQNAIEVNFNETPTRVFSAEYLAAIMLDTGRAKDHARLVQFFELDVLNLEVLLDLIRRHHLEAKWLSFKARFLDAAE